MSETKQSIGAWKKQTPKGEVINFTIDGKKYSMWANAYKKDDKHPDFKIYEDTWKPTSQPTERKTAADNIKPSQNTTSEPFAEELPF